MRLRDAGQLVVLNKARKVLKSTPYSELLSDLNGEFLAYIHFTRRSYSEVFHIG